jgi:hypothetical protein
MPSNTGSFCHLNLDIHLSFEFGYLTLRITLNSSLKTVKKYSLGYCLGCGIVIKKKINVGIRYLGLGELEMKGEAKFGKETESIDAFDQAISILLISTGIQL